MTAQHDIAHLASLIQAARTEAAKLGPEGGGIVLSLDQALLATRELEMRGGRADEGLRPEDLTSGNDK